MQKIVRESIIEDIDKQSLINKLIDDDIDRKFIEDLRSSEDYRHNTSFPPEQLERELGLNNISRDYKMPWGLKENDIETLAIMFSESFIVLEHLFYDLLELNPELKVFEEFTKKGKPKDSDMYPLFHIIMGITSKMNPHDIYDYVKNKPYAINVPKRGGPNRFKFTRRDNKSEDYAELYNAIYRRGYDLNYFPSMRTLNLILKNIHV